MGESGDVSRGSSPIHLPVIDLSGPSQVAGKQMLDAAIEYGFFYVDSRNVPDFDAQAVDRLFDLVLLRSIEVFVLYYTTDDY